MPRVRWYRVQLSIKCSKTITCMLVNISLQSHVMSWGQENHFKWLEKIRYFWRYQLEFYMFTPFTPFMPSYESTTAVIIFWRFLMFYQILFSPQVKQSMITSNKDGIWELPKRSTAPEAMMKTKATRITLNGNRMPTHQTTMATKMIYTIMCLMRLMTCKTWKWSSIKHSCLKYVSFIFTPSHAFFTFCWFANIYQLKIFKNLPFAKISTR